MMLNYGFLLYDQSVYRDCDYCYHDQLHPIVLLEYTIDGPDFRPASFFADLCRFISL